MRVHLAEDPGGRALRRASRIALILPLTLYAAMHLPFINEGALLAAFACLSQTLFADFGGSLKRRFISYLATTAAGVPLIIVGTLASPYLVASVLAAFVVAMIVGLLGVLRGVVASAQTVLLLSLVLALTAVRPGTMWPSVAAWVFGGLVAAIASVTVWPVRTVRPIRNGIAAIFDEIADACDARWITQDADALAAARDAATAALADLHAKYDGNLMRPSGATDADEALSELVDEAGRLRYLQRWQDVSGGPDEHLHRIMASECRQVTASLRACAARLRGSRSPLSSQALLDLRIKNLDDVSQWFADHQETANTTHLREQLDDAFPLRITTVVTSHITDASIRIERHPGDQLAVLPGDQETGALLSRWNRLRPHLSWDSPWFRNAARTAVALAISVAVAKSVSLEHPFWIVLGTLSALRFDAMGTGRQAWQALVGTTVGVAISAVVLTIVGQDPLVWWALLPIAVFIAGYTPGTMSFAVGQAAFSFVVIVLFSIIAPSGLDLAEARWFDVALGLLISLLVSLLMWPRGVVETLFKRMSEAMTAATDFYVATTDWMAGGAIDDRLLQEFRKGSRQAIDRAREAVDLSIAQRPPQVMALQRWTALSNTIRHVDFAARLAPQGRESVLRRGGNDVVPGPLVGPLLACSNDLRDRLTQAMAQWNTSSTTPYSTDLPTFTQADSVQALRAAVDAYLTTPSDWAGAGPDPRPAIITWLADWAALFDQSAQIIAKQS